MRSGPRAFAGETTADTLTAILTKDAEDLSRPGFAVPAGLERIVRRCLEKDPEERFQSAKHVAFALEAEPGPSRQGARPSGRRASSPRLASWRPPGRHGLCFGLRVQPGGKEDRAQNPAPVLTPDGEAYAYTYFRGLQDLYLVEGLRY